MSVSESVAPRRAQLVSAKPLALIVASLVAISVVVMFSVTLQQWTILGFLIAAVFLLRRNEVTASLIIVAQIVLDWGQLLGIPLYWPLISLVCAGLLLIVLFFSQSREHPWVRTPFFWLWVAILALGLYPAKLGLIHSQSIQYYIDIFLASMLMFIIGAQVSTDRHRLRTIASILAAFGAVIGLHSIIYTATGVFLFEPSALASYLYNSSNFVLSGTTIQRAGSFLQNPDWNGAFLAMLLLLPVGLAWSAQSMRVRILYVVEAGLIAGGLISTFSIGSILALAVSAFFFIILITKTNKQRLIAVGSVVLAGGATLLVKPSLLRVFVQHGQTGSVSSRLGAWETAIRVILVHPLTGVGLGYQSYLTRAEPYRSVLQYRPLAHPHESFLELAAMAGIPLLLVFIALLGLAFWQAIRLWRSVDDRQRVVVAAILCSVLTLTLNSLTVNAWTTSPLAMTGWLLFGALISPALAASEQRLATQVKRPQPERAPAPAVGAASAPQRQ
jgi:O-antigen ligase